MYAWLWAHLHSEWVNMHVDVINSVVYYNSIVIIINHNAIQLIVTAELTHHSILSYITEIIYTDPYNVLYT